MKKSLSYLSCLLTVAAIACAPGAARADINYTFIKMTCDPGSKSVTIKTFYDWNEAGKARAKRHEKDTYYLDEIASYEKPSKAISCDFGKGHTLSFIAIKGFLPRDNGITVFLNGKELTSYSLAYGDQSATIREIKDNGYELKSCLPPVRAKDIPHGEGKCTLSRIVNGKIDKKYQLVDP